MPTGNWRRHLGFESDGEFDTEWGRCCSIVGASAPAEVNDAYEPKRAEHCVVELATTIDVSDAERHMIQHGCFLGRGVLRLSL
jgi:hypothetical protein